MEHTLTLEGAGHLVDEIGQEKVQAMLHEQFQAMVRTLRKKVGLTDVATAVRKDGGAMVITLTLTLRRAWPLLDRQSEDSVRKDFEDALSPIGNLLKDRLKIGVTTATAIRRQR